MTTTLPHDCRFGAQVIISAAQLNAAQIPPSEVLARRSEDMAESLRRHILKECSKISEPDETLRHLSSHAQVVISADLYVLSPEQLSQLLSEARADGAAEESRWAARAFQAAYEVKP